MLDVPNARRQALDLGLDPLTVESPVYSPLERQVLDERPAEQFFATPRIGVAHTDAGFTRQLQELYRRVLVPLVGSPAAVLDLCSSWDSHLPPELVLGQVVGHGINEEELEANPRLTSRFVRDLNAHTKLPLPSASVGAVLCCNGIQYLTKPEWVLAEVGRVLRPAGVVAVAFSGSCWRERAAAGWLARDGKGRMQLVARLLQGAGLTVTRTESNVPSRPGEDPFFAVVAQKPSAEPLAPLMPPVAEPDPVATARAFMGPALQELDLGTTRVAPLMLERWRESYSVLVEDAVELGIPRSAVPALSPDASAEDIRAARDHLRRIMESFLSAGL